jgi:chromosome segregation ATPase
MSDSQQILDALRRLEERLGTKIDERISEFRLEMNARFDAIEVRLDRLETEYEMIKVALARIEERLDGDAGDRQALWREVRDLRARVDDLEARVRLLEAKLART